MKAIRTILTLVALAIGIFVGASVSAQSPLPFFILDAQTQIVATVALPDGQVVVVPINLTFVTRSEQAGAYLSVEAEAVQPNNAVVAMDDSKPISASVSAIVYSDSPVPIAVVPPAATRPALQVTAAPEQIVVTTTSISTPTTSTATVATATAATATGEISGEATYGIGDEVMTGDIKWRLITVEDVGNTLTSDSDSIEDATTEGRFIRLLFEIVNQGSDALPYWEPEIVDSQGRSFDAYPARAYFIPDEQECLLLTVEPGLVKECVEIYEVAADAQGLKLKVSDFGLIYGNEALIDLE